MKPWAEKILAVNFRIADRVPDLLVVHTMESPEKAGTARAIAEWFAGKRGPAPRTSAHFCIDPSVIIQCVDLKDVAFHAPGVNNRGVGLEFAGRANQTAEQWADEDSTGTLDKGAELGAYLCAEFKIPNRKLSPQEILDGAKGICGHWDVTQAYPRLGTHTDPGEFFPWESFIDKIGEQLRR